MLAIGTAGGGQDGCGGPPGAVERLRRATRPSICSAPSTCCPKDYRWRTREVRPGGRRLAGAGRRDHHRRQAIRMQMMAALAQPRLLAEPAADRRLACPPTKRAALEAAIAQERDPARGVRPDGNLGRGVHAARQPVQGARPQGRRRRRDASFATASRSQGKPIGELETNARATRLFRRACRNRPSARCSKARSRSPRTCARSSRHARGLGRAATSTPSPGPSTTTWPASPELRDALLKRRNANWSRWVEQRMATPGSVHDRGRRGPSRGQRFGRRSAPAGRTTRSGGSSKVALSGALLLIRREKFTFRGFR